MSFADRIEESKKEVEKKRKILESKTKFKLTDDEVKYARSLLALKDNEDWKNIVELENKELGNILATAFEKPIISDFASIDFGEQMSFNKGKYIGILKLRQRRQMLVNIYLHILEEQMKSNKGEKDGKDKNS